MVVMVITPHKDNHGLTPPQQMSVPGDEGIRSSLRDSSQTCKGCFIMHIIRLNSVKNTNFGLYNKKSFLEDLKKKNS